MQPSKHVTRCHSGSGEPYLCKAPPRQHGRPYSVLHSIAPESRPQQWQYKTLCYVPRKRSCSQCCSASASQSGDSAGAPLPLPAYPASGSSDAPSTPRSSSAQEHASKASPQPQRLHALSQHASTDGTSSAAEGCSGDASTSLHGVLVSSDVPSSTGHASSSTSPVPTQASTSAPQGGSQAGGLWASVQRVASEQFLPLMLLVVLALAYIQPAWGLAASLTPLQSIVTASIFVLQGLMLQQGQAAAALADRGSVTWGVTSILLLTPLAAPLVGCLPLDPPGLGFGLMLFYCMPTTLSAGVALTTALGGNTAMALLLTISSNLLATFTLPFMLPWALATTGQLKAGLAAVMAAGAGGAACALPAGGTAAAAAALVSGVALEPWPLLRQLLLSILLPTLIGLAARASVPGLAPAVDACRRQVTYLNGFMLSLIPWMQVSKALSGGVSAAPLAVLGAVVASLALHVCFLLFNSTALRVLHLGSPEVRRAVIIVASQKTLPVAMAVLARLSAGGEVPAGVLGLAAMTCVLCHLAQTCFDFWLVSVWNGRLRDKEATAAAAAGQAA